MVAAGTGIVSSTTNMPLRTKRNALVSACELVLLAMGLIRGLNREVIHGE